MVIASGFKIFVLNKIQLDYLHKDQGWKKHKTATVENG